MGLYKTFINSPKIGSNAKNWFIHLLSSIIYVTVNIWNPFINILLYINTIIIEVNTVIKHRKYTIFVSYDFITHIHANIGDFHEYIQIRTTRETGRND